MIDTLPQRANNSSVIVANCLAAVALCALPAPANADPVEKKESGRLLQRLDDRGASSPEDLIEGAIESMRMAGRRISEKDTGEETRRIQSDVVGTLEKLIERARQAQASPQADAPQSQSTQQRRSIKPGSETAGKQKSAATAADDRAATGRPNPRKAADSSQRDREGTAQKEEQLRIARRRALVEEVWGHLPEHVRQRLKSMRNESYLPRYSGLIREYFEALAE